MEVAETHLELLKMIMDETQGAFRVQILDSNALLMEDHNLKIREIERLNEEMEENKVQKNEMTVMIGMQMVEILLA